MRRDHKKPLFMFQIKVDWLSNNYGGSKPDYSKSQIFVQKFNFVDKTPTFSRVFHPNFFDNFSREIKGCQQLKSPKPQHFHEFSTQKNRQIYREIKVEF